MKTNEKTFYNPTWEDDERQRLSAKQRSRYCRLHGGYQEKAPHREHAAKSYRIHHQLPPVKHPLIGWLMKIRLKLKVVSILSTFPLIREWKIIFLIIFCKRTPDDDVEIMEMIFFLNCEKCFNLCLFEICFQGRRPNWMWCIFQRKIIIIIF